MLSRRLLAFRVINLSISARPQSSTLRLRARLVSIFLLDNLLRTPLVCRSVLFDTEEQRVVHNVELAEELGVFAKLDGDKGPVSLEHYDEVILSAGV